MNNLIIIFSILTMLNVILSTIKSLMTIKCGKFLASLASAGYYGYYNIVIIYTVADFPIIQKIVITALCNLIGVYLVKWAEEKTEKDKLWKIECTLPKDNFNKDSLENIGIPFNYIDINKYYLVNFYCATKEQSKIVKKMLTRYDAKYFVNESKSL